jgi:TetR/AcrR family acrAB operon transcriptional repressor
MRRTKEDAAKTRASIVEAALACFERHGIAGSTLGQIAAAAGVTKGAVYHHFASKGAILHELRRHVSVPLLDEADTGLLSEPGHSPLERIERFLAGFLETIVRDAHTRGALNVMQFKCEYVDGLGGELRDMVRNNTRLLAALRRAYRDAREAGELSPAVTPEIAALETDMFLSGLVRMWLLHPPTHALRRGARAAIRAHVALRRRPLR